MSDEIPEDVMKKARELATTPYSDFAGRRDEMANALLSERLAQRERCAKIAESHQLEEDFTLKALQIAAAIRGDGQ